MCRVLVRLVHVGCWNCGMLWVRWALLQPVAAQCCRRACCADALLTFRDLLTRHESVVNDFFSAQYRGQLEGRSSQVRQQVHGCGNLCGAQLGAAC